jgi:hypothetical protein
MDVRRNTVFKNERVLALLWLFCLPIFLYGITVDDQLHQVTTLISVDSAVGSSQASGFFYNRLGPADPAKSGPQWRSLAKTWVVTNRHVVLSRAQYNLHGNLVIQEFLPLRLTFNLRKEVGQGKQWDPIMIDQAEIVKRTKCHPDPDVDVCVIDVGDLISTHFTDGIKAGVQYMPFGAISKEMLPGNNKITVEAGDAVIVAGYPKGFYDDVNLFPVLKGGIIGSRWGANFKGKPYFLIDGQMFPGSSGSLVISKPTNIVVENGQMFTSKDKQFAVLGILSGETWESSANREFELSTSLSILVKGAVNTGIVWYSSLIEEITLSGVPPTPIAPRAQ